MRRYLLDLDVALLLNPSISNIDYFVIVTRVNLLREFHIIHLSEDAFVHLGLSRQIELVMRVFGCRWQNITRFVPFLNFQVKAIFLTVDVDTFLIEMIFLFGFLTLTRSFDSLFLLLLDFCIESLLLLMERVLDLKLLGIAHQGVNQFQVSFLLCLFVLPIDEPLPPLSLLLLLLLRLVLLLYSLLLHGSLLQVLFLLNLPNVLMPESVLRVLLSLIII